MRMFSADCLAVGQFLVRRTAAVIAIMRKCSIDDMILDNRPPLPAPAPAAPPALPILRSQPPAPPILRSQPPAPPSVQFPPPSQSPVWRLLPLVHLPFMHLPPPPAHLPQNPFQQKYPLIIKPEPRDESPLVPTIAATKSDWDVPRRPLARYNGSPRSYFKGRMSTTSHDSRSRSRSPKRRDRDRSSKRRDSDRSTKRRDRSASPRRAADRDGSSKRRDRDTSPKRRRDSSPRRRDRDNSPKRRDRGSSPRRAKDSDGSRATDSSSKRRGRDSSPMGVEDNDDSPPRSPARISLSPGPSVRRSRPSGRRVRSKRLTQPGPWVIPERPVARVGSPHSYFKSQRGRSNSPGPSGGASPRYGRDRDDSLLAPHSYFKSRRDRSTSPWQLYDPSSRSENDFQIRF
ncbi:hypothetical protein B0H16DRAFT_809344 [Mycena metata]|uniref:Uncharacterized protein n=1 Tax=Mycena metata TaxID=1033252 RepID=A0AAD7K6L5_9AGAR|nr:hypothetical protein B0H16DRAFT_809344 [Mycena metata]